MIALKIFVGTTVTHISNLIVGLWFLIRHPITFNKFIAEYRKFEDRIDENDLVAQSGFYDMPRRMRRALGRNIKKSIGTH